MMSHVGTLGFVAALAGAGGFVIGRETCEPEEVVTPPVVVTVRDTVEVPPQWILDLVSQMEKDLAKKPRRDTLFLAQEVTVVDSFPYPVYVKDTTARFWWPERATFGQKPGDVTTVVTREPFSGKATVLRYQTPGPVISFAADTAPRPRIDFGTFSKPKKQHGLLTDILLTAGSFGVGSIAGYIGGRARCLNGG